MITSKLRRVVPFAFLVGLSGVIMMNQFRSNTQTATLFSPSQAEAGVDLPANNDNIILCTGQGTFPVVDSSLANDNVTQFWVYEYTGSEPPMNGKYYVSYAQQIAHPDTSHGPALTQMQRNKIYYVHSDRTLHFQCGIGLSVKNTAGAPTAPVITSISPSSGPWGTLITINGSGFSTVSNVIHLGQYFATLASPDGIHLSIRNTQYSDNATVAVYVDTDGKTSNVVSFTVTQGTAQSSSAGITGGNNSGPQCQTVTCSYTVGNGNCQYVPGRDQNGCPVCGSVVCSQSQASQQGQPQCQSVDCAAPPSGCRYINPVTDGNGCVLNCGQLACSGNSQASEASASTASHAACRPIDCASSGPGCTYQNPVFRNGCMISCGEPLCSQPPQPSSPSSHASASAASIASTQNISTLTGNIASAPSYADLTTKGNTVAFDVTLSDNQGSAHSAYIGLFPMGPGEGADQTVSFVPTLSDTRCRAMRTSADANGNYDPIYSPYDIHSAAVFCPLGDMTAGQTVTVHIVYRVLQSIQPACDPAGSVPDPGLLAAEQAGSMESHAAASKQIGPVPICPQQASSQATTSCNLPSDYFANASMYGTRFNRQHTSDNSYVVYSATDAGHTDETVYLKGFDKNTCQTTVLDKNPYLDCVANFTCTAQTYKGIGFDEPSVSDDGKVLDIEYQKDAPTHSQKIFHSLYILDKNGNKIATIVQQAGIGSMQIAPSPTVQYSNTDAQISRDGSKVVFEAFTQNGNLDTASGQPWLLPYGFQVYVWQNGKISEITRYNGSENLSQDHPWDWDARFEDSAGRFISLYLGYDPDTGSIFPHFQPGGALGSFWMPAYKLYLYDSQTHTFYKISDDINPSSREAYQSVINAKIVSLGGATDQSSSSSQQSSTSSVSTGGPQCTQDSDCGQPACNGCNGGACLRICRIPYCNNGTCSIRFSS